MKHVFLVISLVLAFTVGFFVHRQQATPAVAASMAATSPATGWSLHIDAKRHFGDAHPNEIAHHWCRATAGGMLECQIYDSDAPNAHLVAVEAIVQPGVYKSFSASEKALWHWHKTEVPKVDAKLPGMSPAQQAKVVAMILPTYGKVYVLYDPIATHGLPTGQPWVSILK